MSARMNLNCLFFHFLILAMILQPCEAFDRIPPADPNECRSLQTSEILVCDPDGIFTTKEISDLESTIIKIHNETVSPCNASSSMGYTVRLVVYRRYNESLFPGSPSFHQKHAERMQAFAKFLHDQYKDPNDDCDDNVLLFISKEDKAVHIVVGSKAKSRLPKDFQHRMNKQIVTRLTRGNIMDAVRYGLSAVGNNLRYGASHENDSSIQHKKRTIIIVSVMVVLLVVISVIFWGIFRWRKKRKLERDLNGPDGTDTVGYESTDDESDVQVNAHSTNEPNHA